MNTRNSTLSAVVILVVVGCSPLVFAGPAYIYGGDFNLPIIDKPGPGSEMTEAIINVPNYFVIIDLDVQINITHTNVFDLQLFVQSPLGTRICLNMYDFKKEFSVYPNYTQTIFDDEASLSIKQGQAPFTGRFKPIKPYKLSKFDGQDSFGLWHLQIYDMWDTDTGTLNRFELMIETPEPATAILLLLGTGLITLFKPRRNRKDSCNPESKY